MPPFIEIRTLTLKANARDEFHRRYIEQVLPLLKRWNFDVVAHGPSLHDEKELKISITDKWAVWVRLLS